jgi:acyl-CoA thioester hydrolase
MAFERTFPVTWMHLDANGHMANTAYINVCIDVRMMYFASRGFAASEFARLRVGPVVRRDEVDYYRELHLLDPIRVTLLLAGLSDDASRFKLRNEIHREDGQLAARLTSLGGWFDLNARKLIAPPQPIADALRALDRTEDFEKLESSVRK